MKLRHAAPAAIGVAIVVVSGCGADRGGEPATTSGSVPVGGSASTQATSVTAYPTGLPTSTPAPGSPARIAPGEVSVRLDAGTYQVGALIHVTVSNRTDRPISTEDFKTECSVVILQHRGSDGGWSDVTGCVLGRPTETVTIGPGRGAAVELNPASVHLSHGEPGGPAFGKGTYRVKFTYRNDPTPAGQDPFTVYSPEFTIH